MEAATWTALGILAAFSLGVLALQVSQNARIEGVNGRIDGLGDRVDGLGERVDGLSERVDGLSERVDGLSERVDRTAESLRTEMREGDRQTREEIRREIRALGDRLEGRLQEHEARHHP